jgi:proteic killer suppression protein
VKFRNAATEDLYNGKSTKASRTLVPPALVSIARRKVVRIATAATLEGLRFPPGNQLEALKGDRAGQHSIRINEKYRICFLWVKSEAEEIEVTDYH